MKRKLLSLLLVLAMVLAVFPVSALAAGGTGQPILAQDGLLFEFNTDQTSTYHGVFVKGLDPNAEEPVTEVEIPSVFADEMPVAGIADGAFKNTDITSVHISDGVTYIGDSAFEGCKQLVDVTFEGAYADLGIDCFKNCTSLEEMYVPDTGVIPSGTFEGCTSLGIVTLEYGNMVINEGAFKGCTALEYIYLPASIEQIYTKDFEGLDGLIVNSIPNIDKDPSIAQKFATKMGFDFVPEEYPTDEAAWFSDVTGGQYYSVPVLWGSMTGVVAGNEDGSFGPDDKCTRGQMIAFLWRLNGCPAPKAEEKNYHKFCDVPSDTYYTVAVQWAYEEGITAGTGPNKDGKDTFSPNETVTREQVISLLWRMDGEPKAVATTTPFTDVSSSGYYYKALLWASETKVVAGISDTTFGLGEPCTRGMIVTFLYRNLYHMYRSIDPMGKFV